MSQNLDQPLLLALQAPLGLPESSQLGKTTDPLIPSGRLEDIMEHFPDTVYDKSPESYLSRFVKVLCGDAGAGVLRKRYDYSHLSSVIWTSNFFDLDRLYGDIFGFSRMVEERLAFNPYHDNAVEDDWDEIAAHDAAYRTRVQELSTAFNIGGTLLGIKSAAEALCGIECRVYESYLFVDENGGNDGGNPPAWNARTYQEVEDEFGFYSELELNTYAEIEAPPAWDTYYYEDIEDPDKIGWYTILEEFSYGQLEGTQTQWGRTTSNNRKEFIVRPGRPISYEEGYKMIQVLDRLKPADTILTVNYSGVLINTPIFINKVFADSTYWKVRQEVIVKPGTESAYPYPVSGSPQEQPRPVFSEYQGEAWANNGDIDQIMSYAEDGTTHRAIQTEDWQRITMLGVDHDFTPDKAFIDGTALMQGRYASDGILQTTVAQRSAA